MGDRQQELVEVIASAAAQLVEVVKVSGDGAQRFRKDSNGKLEWGNGTNAPDVNLYRGSSDELKTDDLMDASGYRDNNVNTASTGTNFTAGTYNLSSTSTAYTLATPTVGDIVDIHQTSTATGGITVTCQTTNETYDGTNDIATFNGVNDHLSLKALSTTRWAVVSNEGGVAFS